MARKTNTAGTVITRINDTGSDIYPYRVVKLSTDSSEIEYATSTSAAVIGVTLFNHLTSAGTWGDDDAVAIQIDGIAEIDAAGMISAGDYVVATTSGKVVSGGSVSDLSSVTQGYYVVGIALESGTNGTRVSVLLRPQII